MPPRLPEPGIGCWLLVMMVNARVNMMNMSERALPQPWLSIAAVAADDTRVLVLWPRYRVCAEDKLIPLCQSSAVYGRGRKCKTKDEYYKRPGHAL